VTDAGRTGCQDRVENNLTGVWNHERFVAAERCVDGLKSALMS
jgi:hypothetical protein